MTNPARLLREMRYAQRRILAIQIVLRELRQLQEKYSDSPDIVEYLLGLEHVVQKHLSQYTYSLQVKQDKLRKLQHRNNT